MDLQRQSRAIVLDQEAAEAPAGGSVPDAAAGKAPWLGRLRLLVALDCLLVEGSVGRAAERMGLSAPAMSRILSQVRTLFDDPLFVRSGHRLVPTPRAEALRERLRALATEAEALLDDHPRPPAEADSAALESWQKLPIVKAPPLSMRPSILLDDEPSPDAVARQLAKVREENDPRKRLAKYIAIIGRKAGSSRPLTTDEAQDAFTVVLERQADPAQVGGLLRLLSYRGETAAELAGIVLAARSSFHQQPAKGAADLDWPAYLSPLSPRAPWFLQAARLVAMAGHRVLVHGSLGSGSAGGKLELAAEMLGIPVCASISAATAALRGGGNIAYLPLASFGPKLQGMLALYPLFESRSSANAAVHLLDPLGARASFLGVAQPAYRDLHRDAAVVLGGKDLSVIGNSRDVAEWQPYRPATVFRLVGGQSLDLSLRSLPEPKAEPRIGLTSAEYWRAVWSGAAQDPRAVRVVTATTALALMTVEGAGQDTFEKWHAKAEDLWSRRLK
jgi:anthranilate phosphoribosyltransferase